jgi:hypothetical protein
MNNELGKFIDKLLKDKKEIRYYIQCEDLYLILTHMDMLNDLDFLSGVFNSLKKEKIFLSLEECDDNKIKRYFQDLENKLKEHEIFKISTKNFEKRMEMIKPKFQEIIKKLETYSPSQIEWMNNYRNEE